MSYYSKEEQETHYHYDVIDEVWRIDSTYPPHIKKLLNYATITDKTTNQDGLVIGVRGSVGKNQIRLFKTR